jgi:hypothetical protein
VRLLGAGRKNNSCLEGNLKSSFSVVTSDIFVCGLLKQIDGLFMLEMNFDRVEGTVLDMRWLLKTEENIVVLYQLG